MKTKHIEIRPTETTVELIMDDYELFDYIDDLITEKGLEYEFTSEEMRDGRTFYKMHFGKSVSEVHLSEIIGAIPLDEIQRIWELNNLGPVA